VAFGIPGAVAAIVFAHKFPGPEWIGYAAAAGWAVLAAAGWGFMLHRNGRTAFVGLLAVIVAGHAAAFLYRTVYLDRYADDEVFLEEVQRIAPADAPLFVLNEMHPLNAAWVLYETGPRAKLLHHWTFLSSDRISATEVYVIGRRTDERSLAGFGRVERLAESAHTRGETSPMDRYTLFRLRFFPDLVRLPEPRLNALQATGRKYGPIMPTPKRASSK
jgi:hypothetical protein